MHFPPLAAIMQIEEDCEIVVETTAGRCLLFNTAIVTPKAMKDTQGVSCFSLKKNNAITKARPYLKGEFVKPGRYRTKSLPSAGAVLSTEDIALKTNMTLQGFDE